MWTVVKWTLWQRRWSIGWWTLGVVAFIVLELAFYPTIRDQAGELEESFARLSDSAMALFSDTGDFFSPVGYLSGQVFYLMMPMLLGVLAISAGASLIGREEREGTLELLLSRPVSRGKLMAAEALTGTLIIMFVGVVGTVAASIAARLVNLPVPFDNILLAGLAASLLALSFGAVAFTITMLGRSARSASIGVAALVALAGYLISSLATTVDWLLWPAKFFPFDYYHPAEILNGTYNWLNIVIIIGLIGICGFISWRAFRRRDLGV